MKDMKNIKKIILFCLILTVTMNLFLPVMAEGKKDENKNKVKKERTLKVNFNEKDFNKIEKKPDANANTSSQNSASTTNPEELIPVNVKNEFDEEIRVKLDTNREYPVGPHEWITLGQRKPGRYTLTISNKKGEFVDNLTKNIDKVNKFVLNDKTVSNSGKITGLSTGQKVAITAGAIGAAALGTALVNKFVQGKQEQAAQDQYVPPPALPPVVQQVPQNVDIPQEVQPEQPAIDRNNAIASGGKAIKILNSNYSQVTLIVEGTDGRPVGNNWVIPKGTAFQKPEPLIFSGEKITINPNQKLKAVLPDGTELQRNGFELDTDTFDSSSYVWVIK